MSEETRYLFSEELRRRWKEAEEREDHKRDDLRLKVERERRGYDYLVRMKNEIQTA